MRAVSRKKQRRDRIYPQRRKQAHDRAGGACEAIASAGCTGRCEQIHHVAGRGGQDPHRLDNLLAVCGPCHMQIHRFPAESYERGWMRSRIGGGGHV